MRKKMAELLKTEMTCTEIVEFFVKRKFLADQGYREYIQWTLDQVMIKEAQTI